MTKTPKIIIVLLMCIGVYLSLFKLTESPPVWYDEGIYNQIAISQSVYGRQGIQVAPNELVSSGFVTGGFPFIFPIALSMDIFGIGIFQARIVMVIFIALLLYCIYHFSSEVFGKNKAIVGLLLVVTFPILYGNGKNVLGEIPGLLYLFLFLISVNSIVKTDYQKLLPYLFAGLFGGLCLASKPVFFLLGGAVLVAVLIHRKSIKFNWLFLISGLVIFLIPMMLWFKFQFLSSDNALSILGYYANPYGLQDILRVIWNNMIRFLHEPGPIYFAFFELIWILSYVYRSVKKGEIKLVESIAFIFSILVSLAYLRTAGWYRYYFVAEMLAILFFINNLDYFKEIDFIKKYSNIFNKLIVLLIVIICSIQGYQLFFSSWVATHYDSSVSHDLKNELAKFPSDTTFFIYDVPETTIFLPNQNFYQYLQPTPSLSFGAEQLKVLEAGVPDVVIINSTKLIDNPSITINYREVSKVSNYVILTKNR